MRIIFLDVDGVLNKGSGIMQDRADNFVRFFQSSGNDWKIVVSSTWRKSEQDMARLRAAIAPIAGKIVGMTPLIDDYSRFLEIQAYLQEHPADDHIIIDDLPGLFHHGTDRVYFIPEGRAFTDLDANAIRSMLKDPS